jgi:hypothetical protein
MKTKLSALVAAIAALHGSAASAVTPEEVQKDVDHQNTVLEYDMMATADVIEKFGKSLRVVTWLQECKLDALASAIAPTNDEIQRIVIHYLVNQPNGEAYLWDVLAGVTSSVGYYQIGFKETVKPIRATLGARFCARATEEANTLLQERQSNPEQKSP